MLSLSEINKSIEMNDSTYRKSIMDRVISLSAESVEKGGGPFAAAVVRNGEVVASGTNCVTLNNDPTAHAEVSAIRTACEKLGTFNLSDCVLYTSCEPCPMCLSAAYWARIPQVFYCNTHIDAKNIGFDDSFIYDELAKSPGERSLVLTHIDDEKALEPFRMWDRKADKTPY